ncbi:MAG: alpha/beta hydrolase [Bacteroidales bacterium]|nr:alpha/beta hydrolase [Bacteroidales bacterium]
MKNFLTILLILITTAAGARDFKVHGPQGGIAMDITLPKGLDPETEKCPMVILMHGIFSSGNIVPIPALARELADNGIASIRFDFGGHWRSEGEMQQMTIGKEIEDALAMWEYAKTLPYVSEIGLLGHSQGGVVASMTAGILESRGEKPAGLVLIAPGSVVQDACRNGRFFGAEFNPADPPEFVKCFGIMKLGREYILSTQDLDIYGTAKDYTGPVRLIHGSKDTIVPMSCSERYAETYGDRSELIVVEGENHLITRKKKKVVVLSVGFFKEVWNMD